VIGFGILDQNRDNIRASMINGVAASFETIFDAGYPVSRSTYFYVKNAHIGAFTHEDAWGPYGHLADRGLIPLPEDVRETTRDGALSFAPLNL